MITIPDRIKGFNFVLIGGDGKQPIEKAWQTKIHRFDDPVLIRHLEANKNYGIQSNGSSIVLDGKSYFLVIIDFDQKSFQDKIMPLLPETFTTTSGSEKKCFHLWFACDDNKAFKIKDEKINTLADVIGEGNQVIAPGSKHKSGSVYSVVKDIPFAFISYAELQAILKPYDKSPKKEKKIKTPVVKSLNDDVASKVVASISMKDILHELGINTDKNPTNCFDHPSKMGQCFSWNDEVAHCFHCDNSWNKFSLVRDAKKLTDKETFEWFAEKAGMLDELKKARKEFVKVTEQEVSINDDEKVEIILPYQGTLISTFAKKVANILRDKNTLFYRPDLQEVVEITELRLQDKIVFQGFKIVKPSRFITLVERYIRPYMIDQKGQKIYKSMSSDLANTLLQSSQIQDVLPRIDKIFTVPIPIMYQGNLTFPNPGYDARFNSWLSFDAPTISNPNMSLETAKELIFTIYQEFCFKDNQDFINAVAALLTPSLKGIFNKPNTRTPVNFYQGNRERSGKDYCAGVTGIVYEGQASEDSPISNSENSHSNNTEELRKKILATFISGRKRMHFSNNKGYIDNAVLESLATAEKWNDRLLGQNRLLSFDNDLDLSLSGNVGVTFTPDFANRCRFINLFLDIEDANSRRFNNPQLHDWIKLNRGLILSALFALIRNWIEHGKPSGKISFASYPEWAEICGGVMESAGYESPCTPDKQITAVGGDPETQDMKVLFELCHAKYPGQWINRNHIIQIINDEEIFSYLDFSNRSDQTKFGIQLNKFVGRVLSDIRLIVANPEARGSRQQYKFGKVGNSGNVQSPVTNQTTPIYNSMYNVAKDAKDAKMEVEF